ncbi:MAG: hypothetical protein ACE37B_01380 [Ilumatobacter sp.]|uniref:hypothetical protein n=1 Tax=Ilumatobacter sp. TaxID=1967498 RepID=UPI003918F759
MPITGSVTKLDQEIERPGISHPSRRPESQQCLSVDRDRQLACFLVRHPTDPQSRIQLDKRTRHPSKILSRRIRNAIDVGCLSLSAVRPSGKSSDEQVFNPVVVERCQDPVRVECSPDLVRHRTPQARGLR